MSDTNDQLRRLPSVDVLASRIEAGHLTNRERVSIAREALDNARSRIMAGEPADPSSIAQDLSEAVTLRSPTSIINGTGVILHTNLGRAPLSAEAAQAAQIVATRYSNNELDRVDGERGKRGWHTARLLRQLTGAEAAHVVNNNAAAVFLTLMALAGGRSVPVSRSELIEIGGSYRLPELMKASGAKLVEVGTTNRTRLGDFVTALQVHHCGMVLKVHHANYELTGFVSEVSVADLAATAGVPVVFDIGSGLLDSDAPWLDEAPDWLRSEPGARQALADGADLVLFSGDKMLGGPQAGVIVGRADLVEAIRSHPVARAVRVDAPTDAALAATLGHYITSQAHLIPFWRMATLTWDELEPRVERLRDRFGGVIERGSSLVGAGSAPAARIDSPVLRLVGRQDAFVPLLRASRPVLLRRDGGDLLVDLRTVDAGTDIALTETLGQCL